MFRFLRDSKPRSLVNNNVQVTNGIVQIITTSVNSYAPSAVIPGSVAQILGSIYAICHSDSRNIERIFHFLQAVVALGRLGLAIDLMFDRQECDASSDDTRCIISFLLQLIYSGIVSVGLAASALANNSPFFEEHQAEIRESFLQNDVFGRAYV